MMPSTAANISQYAGEALSPVGHAINLVDTNGVDVPNMPAANANAIEKQVVRTWAGTISTRHPSIVPL